MVPSTWPCFSSQACDGHACGPKAKNIMEFTADRGGWNRWGQGVLGEGHGEKQRMKKAIVSTVHGHQLNAGISFKWGMVLVVQGVQALPIRWDGTLPHCLPLPLNQASRSFRLPLCMPIRWERSSLPMPGGHSFTLSRWCMTTRQRSG